MYSQHNIFHLIWNASLVVQLVIAVLLLASIFSWSVIFNKYPLLKTERRKALEFEKLFWNTEDLSGLYQRYRSGRSGALARIFCSGFEEFDRLREQAAKVDHAQLDGAERVMRVEIEKEMESLESYLPFLATVGSTSPYIGLFGTVWGIMHSFNALGNVQQATIAAVGPGIAEALVATAIGLFAAIPAVIAYNRFSHDLDRLIARYDIFSQEFSAILNRHA